jgi:hypothetical protein
MSEGLCRPRRGWQLETVSQEPSAAMVSNSG